jgi:hypothetical protein
MFAPGWRDTKRNGPLPIGVASNAAWLVKNARGSGMNAW